MEPPRIRIDEPLVQEACAAIFRETVFGPDEEGPEAWKLIVAGAACWMARADRTPGAGEDRAGTEPHA